MSSRTRHLAEPLRNKAQEEHAAADTDVKKFADHASFADQETWEHPVGHSGTRRAWALSLAMLASFILGAFGLAVGPQVLLWIGVGAFVLLGALSVRTKTWTDYVAEKRPESDDERDCAQ